MAKAKKATIQLVGHLHYEPARCQAVSAQLVRYSCWIPTGRSDDIGFGHSSKLKHSGRRVGWGMREGGGPLAEWQGPFFHCLVY